MKKEEIINRFSELNKFWNNGRSNRPSLLPTEMRLTFNKVRSLIQDFVKTFGTYNPDKEKYHYRVHGWPNMSTARVPKFAYSKTYPALYLKIKDSEHLRPRPFHIPVKELIYEESSDKIIIKFFSSRNQLHSLYVEYTKSLNDTVLDNMSPDYGKYSAILSFMNEICQTDSQPAGLIVQSYDMSGNPADIVVI